jgi:hypothetical protein
MKIIFNVFVMVLCMFSFSSAGMKFSKVQSVGLLKHKVIYSSPKFKVKKTAQGIKAYVKMIAMWGVHVYEVGVSEYNCTTSGDCEFNQWISLAKYESCQVAGAKAKCSGKISGSSVSNSEKYSYATKGYLETYEAEYERENSSSRHEVDFPERGNQYWEYPSALF